MFIRRLILKDKWEQIGEGLILMVKYLGFWRNERTGQLTQEIYIERLDFFSLKMFVSFGLYTEFMNFVP